MSRQQQGQNYSSGHHQTSYPYSSQQYGEPPQPPPNTYNNRPPSQHAQSSYPDGSSQYSSSGQGHAGHSPHMGTVSFPVPHHFPSSQTPQNLTVPAHHQHQRRGSHGHSPSIGSSSDSQRLYTAGASSDTGGGSHFYAVQHEVQPHHGGGYIATAAQPQDWNAAVYGEGRDSRTRVPASQPASAPHNSEMVARPQDWNAAEYDERRDSRTRVPASQPASAPRNSVTVARPQDWNAAVYNEGSDFRTSAPASQPASAPHRSQDWNATVYDEGHDSRSKAPFNKPTGVPHPLCRYPRCGNRVFHDGRVNEFREWCSNQHMQDAIKYGVEKPCRTCKVWPRRNGYKYCSGDRCRYPQ